MLLDAGIPPNSNCASRAIGYRQAMEFLQRCRAAEAAGVATADADGAAGTVGSAGQQREAVDERRVVRWQLGWS